MLFYCEKEKLLVGEFDGEDIKTIHEFSLIVNLLRLKRLTRIKNKTMIFVQI